MIRRAAFLSLLLVACGRPLETPPDLSGLDLAGVDLTSVFCTRAPGPNGLCCISTKDEFFCEAQDPEAWPLVCDPTTPRCVGCGTPGVPCCPQVDGGTGYCRSGALCGAGGLCP